MLAEESVIIISTIVGSLILIIMVSCYCFMCDTEPPNKNSEIIV
jgi:hypothetical protein